MSVFNTVNRVELLGRVGMEPELTYTPNGNAVCHFSVATDEPTGKKDEEGRYISRTQWTRVVAWRQTAEICENHVKKGQQVLIHGRLSTREFTDKKGEKRWMTEVIAQRVIFLSPSKSTGQEVSSSDAPDAAELEQIYDLAAGV